MSCPVAHLVSTCVVKILRLELSHRGQMEWSRWRAIEDASFVMDNGRIVRPYKFFCLLKGINLSSMDHDQAAQYLRLGMREHAGVAKNGTIQAIGALHLLVGVRIFFCLCRCAGEIANGFGVLASSDIQPLLLHVERSSNEDRYTHSLSLQRPNR